MYKKYIFCRGKKPNPNFIDNIVKIKLTNNIENIYINTGPITPNISSSIDSLINYGNIGFDPNEFMNSRININLALIYDASSAPSGMLDDGNVPIPMGGMIFNFFGVNYGNNMCWNSNNAITFGTTNPHLVSFSHNTIPAILLGNYDRLLRKVSYINSIASNCSITTLYINFYNYFTDDVSTANLYSWRIRLIRQNTGLNHQYVEVCIGSGSTTLLTPGYSSSISSYPSGVNFDSNGYPIDQTKTSPFNITNGTAFLNPCGSTFGVTSPLPNTSFIFTSDSTGTNWKFINNSYVNV